MRNYTITNDEIKKAWGNANFGALETDEQKRKYILCALMKCAMGYHNGFTAMTVLKELKVLTVKELPNAKGRVFLRELYDDLAYKP